MSCVIKEDGKGGLYLIDSGDEDLFDSLLDSYEEDDAEQHFEETFNSSKCIKTPTN